MNDLVKTVIEKMTLKIAVLLSVMFVVFLYLINFSGIGVIGLQKITDGANILDFEFGFSYEVAKNMLSVLGVDGRAFYLTRIIPLDFVFPFSYMLCWGGWIAFLVKQATKMKWCKYLIFIPCFAMLFDWLENVGIIVMLRNYPDFSLLAVNLASISGMLKMVLIFCSVGTISMLLIASIGNMIRAKK